MFDFLKGRQESSEQGSNWADRVFTSGDTLNAEEVEALGQEYAANPQAFYNGYRKTWNEYAEIYNMHIDYNKGNH